jgi:hypothetical protein
MVNAKVRRGAIQHSTFNIQHSRLAQIVSIALSGFYILHSAFCILHSPYAPRMIARVVAAPSPRNTILSTDY